jgi:hypothetical protein
MKSLGRRLALFLVAVGACGGKSAETTPAPGVETRSLSANDPQLSAIARTAARSLRPGRDGKLNFGGVFVGGRELVALGDSIARDIGAEVSGNRRVPFVVCRVGAPGCSSSGGNDDPFTYTFKSFRLAGTTAFVGADAPSPARPDGAICIALEWNGLTWEVKNRRNVGTAESCGR